MSHCNSTGMISASFNLLLAIIKTYGTQGNEMYK
jgi:hypothetical protein